MFTTLSGLKIAVPAKAGEPEYIWRHLRQAEQNVDVYEHAQKLGATPEQNLAAIVEDFEYFSYPYGPIESYPKQLEDNEDGYWQDVSTWKQVGATWILNVRTQNGGEHFFLYKPKSQTLRLESKVAGSNKVKTFFL